VLYYYVCVYNNSLRGNTYWSSRNSVKNVYKEINVVEKKRVNVSKEAETTFSNLLLIRYLCILYICFKWNTWLKIHDNKWR